MHFKISIGNYLIIMTFWNSRKNILGILLPRCSCSPKHWLVCDLVCDLVTPGERADHLLMELRAVLPGHQLALLHSLNLSHRLKLSVANLKWLCLLEHYFELETKPVPTLDGMTPHILSRKGDSSAPVHIYNETLRCAYCRPWSQQLISPRCSPCLSAAVSCQF